MAVLPGKNINQEQAGEFGRNVLILTAGPVISAIVSLLAEPFIARYFAPEVYGPGMLFANIILTLSPVMFLRYNFAIVQAKDKEEASNLFILSLVIFVFLILFSGVLLYLFPVISIKLINFNIAQYIICFLLSIFFTSIAFLMKYWFAYKKIFFLLTVNTIIMQLSATVFLMIAGLLGYRSTESFIWARTLSFIIGPVIFILYFYRNDLKKVLSAISWQKLKTAAVKYKSYPLYEYWGFLITLVLVQVPLVMISKYWGANSTGQYAKAYAIISLFSLTFSDSVNRVFHREIAGRMLDGVPFDRFIITLIKSIIKSTIIPFTLLILIGREVFGVFLGARWEDAGIIGAILVPWFFFSILSSSIRPLYNLFNKQKIFTVIISVFLVTRILLFIICHRLDMDVLHTLLIFSIYSALCFLFEIIYIMYLIKLKYREILFFLMKKILEIFPLVIINYLMDQADITNFYILIGVNGLISLVYLYYYIFKDPVILSLFRNKKISV
jgi:lipopolysaccharide exporter